MGEIRGLPIAFDRQATEKLVYAEELNDCYRIVFLTLKE